MDKLYSIQEVSRLLGIPKDTLRYYDRIGIVSPIRDNNRYRKYIKTDLIDLMHIQIMQYADFSLEEMKGKFNFHKMGNIDPAECENVALFLDDKNAETRKKIDHLEKVSQLLNMTAETLRNPNNESDQRLKKFVRELYEDIPKKEPQFSKEGHDEYQD